MKEIIHEAIIRNLIEFITLDDGLGEWVFNDVADKFAYTTNALDVIHEIDTQIEELVKTLKEKEM